MAKAAVLPVPVWANPTTSRPAISGGMVAAWIGEGVSYPTSETAARTRESMSRSSKVKPSGASGDGEAVSSVLMRGWSHSSVTTLIRARPVGRIAREVSGGHPLRAV